MRSLFFVPLLCVACSSHPAPSDGGTDADTAIDSIVAPDALDAPPDAPSDVANDVAGDLTDDVTDADATSDASVVAQFHYGAARTGWNPNESQLTVAAVSAHFGRDLGFSAMLDGAVYAQPLYMGSLPIAGAAHDTLFVNTEHDTVFALDAHTGATLWMQSIGTPVPLASLHCGNISPYGATSTMALDPATATLYASYLSLDADGTPHYQIAAIDAKSGAIRAGWPITLDATFTQLATVFSDATLLTQGQRSALTLIGRTLYVPFGGFSGDCEPYHGFVVSLDVTNPSHVGLAPIDADPGAGIWAPGGFVAAADGSLFSGTSNGANNSNYSCAVLRFSTSGGDATFSGTTVDWFHPSNWTTLNDDDLDVGSITPLALSGPALGGMPTVVAAGKPGVLYMLDANDLGGAGHGDGVSGEGLFSMRVYTDEMFGSMATFTDATGALWVFTPGNGPQAAPCTGSDGIAALTVHRDASGARADLRWCATGTFESSVTVSSNGANDPIVWMGDLATLRAFTLDGTKIYEASGADAPPSIRHWAPPLVVDGRVYVVTGVAHANQDTSLEEPAELVAYGLR